jgi:hypothetical protein
MATKARKTKSARKPRRNSTANDHHVYDDVLSLANSLLRSQKSRGAEQIRNLAKAAKGFAEDIRDLPEIQNYAHTASKALHELSDYVSETDFQDMMRDAKKFAQRYPIAMAAGALAVGYGALRHVPMPHFGRGKAGEAGKVAKTATRKRRASKKVKKTGKRVSAKQAGAVTTPPTA